MPDILGKKISIKTTSGLIGGMSRNACSPDGEVQTQVKSGNELMSRVQLSRNSGWSSTGATLCCRAVGRRVADFKVSGVTELIWGLSPRRAHCPRVGPPARRQRVGV